MPWGIQGHRGRYDYVSPDHILSEMLNDYYFGGIPHNMREGDEIYVVDAAMVEAVLRVDGVYKDEKRVALSLRETHAFKPAIKAHSDVVEVETPALTVRFKGRRGGNWCVIDADGAIVEQGYQARGEAERRLAMILEAREKAA
jgi:hypothetical protein